MGPRATLRHRLVETGRACYRALRPLRRTTIIGPLIEAWQLRAVVAQLPGDPRHTRVLGPDDLAPYVRALTPLSPYRDLPRDFTFDAIVLRQDQLNTLPPPLLAALQQGYACAFANARFAVFQPTAAIGRPAAAALRASARVHALAAPGLVSVPRTATPADCAILMTTFNRPAALARSLPPIAALGYAVLVVDDGSVAPLARENAALCDRCGVTRLALPENRGLAAAMNAGFAYLMADRAVRWISYFQDDVDVSPEVMTHVRALEDPAARPLITGYDADEHPAEGDAEIAGLRVTLKTSSPAVHLHGHVDYWRSVLPIPSEYVGAPRRRWEASLEDYWIVNHAPNAVARRGLRIPCLPNRVRTFLYDAGDSTWGNPNQPDPPLIRTGA